MKPTCIALILIFFSFQKAQAQLRHEEFLRLQPADQLEYVEHLKSIIRDMTLASLSFADSEEIPSREVASSFQYAPLGDLSSINLSIATAQRELDRFQRLIAEKKSNRLHFMNEAALDKATRSVRIHLVSAAVQAKGLSPAQKATVLRRIQTVNDRFEASLVQNSRLVDPDALYFADSNLRILRVQLNVPFKNLTPSKSTASRPQGRRPSKPPVHVATGKKPLATPASKPQVEARVVAPGNKIAPSVTAPPAPSEKTALAVKADSSAGLCVYAGFIIKRNRCIHEEKLPFQLTEIELEKFICDSPNIICNPLLFGYHSDCKSEDFQECLKTAKPVCTQRVKNATEICSEQSKDEIFTKRAVDLIKKNKTAYEQYLKDFNGLCDESALPENPRLKFTADKRPRHNYKSLLADVLTTCEIAKARLETVTAMYRSVLNPRPPESAAKGRQ